MILFQIGSREMMLTRDRDMWEVGIVRFRLYVEGEGWREVGMVIQGLAEEEVFGLHRIAGEQQVAHSGGGEELGSPRVKPIPTMRLGKT